MGVLLFSFFRQEIKEMKVYGRIGPLVRFLDLYPGTLITRLPSSSNIIITISILYTLESFSCFHMKY